ncbi:hypothetical protein PILCRDRAFT_822991, partial [Piloderma croceum F 1598]
METSRFTNSKQISVTDSARDFLIFSTRKLKPSLYDDPQSEFGSSSRQTSNTVMHAIRMRTNSRRVLLGICRLMKRTSL